MVDGKCMYNLYEKKCDSYNCYRNVGFMYNFLNNS